ncbi:hypothetical protein TNCV_2384561 [Trichonephila clavipes]|nr:hypothetical protein TNCV_2384561 [Trichonephila clavipes]
MKNETGDERIRLVKTDFAPKCLLCNKQHWALMCPELSSNKIRVKTPDLEEKRDVSLSNHCAEEEVLLQTLQVNIKAGGKTQRV